MRFDLAEPCSECPFLRASCPGWTGPWTAAKLVEAIRERPFPCHRTISRDDQRIEDDTLQSCAGAAIFLNNSGAPTYTGWTRHHQQQLKNAPAAVRKRVFETQPDLLAHHSRRTSRNPTPEP